MPGSPLIRLALTPGEPAGIGPDLCVQTAQRPFPCELVVIADPALLESRAKRLGLSVKLREFRPTEPPFPQQAGTLTVLPVPRTGSGEPGSPDPADAGYLLETLRVAVNGCQEGRFAGMVTGPLQKASINDAGIPFTGHTEFLAELTGSRQVVMMLATEGLRVALATTHLPLRQVADAITPELLQSVLRILHEELGRRFGIPSPRIAVCGLNPHAGEGGHLGREEITVIAPVLESLRHEGMNMEGPIPADTLFTPRHLEGIDAVLAMYHDQGLPVLKYKGFGHAANITLGMPIIRTSVDHGTALDLAGTGRAGTGSLLYAVETALGMARTEAAGRQ